MATGMQERRASRPVHRGRRRRRPGPSGWPPKRLAGVVRRVGEGCYAAQEPFGWSRERRVPGVPAGFGGSRLTSLLPGGWFTQ